MVIRTGNLPDCSPVNNNPELVHQTGCMREGMITGQGDTEINYGRAEPALIVERSSGITEAVTLTTVKSFHKNIDILRAVFSMDS